MAISTPTTIIASGATPNSSTYTTAAVTLTANRFYLIVINGYRSGGAVTVNTVVHDSGGTPTNFAVISNATYQGWDTGGLRTLTCWSVIPSSTTANAAITITWSAGQSACGWRLVEVVSGFDTSTPTPFATASNGTNDTPAVDSSAGSWSTDDMTLLIMGWGTGTPNPTQTISPTEGRTELGEHNDGERGSQAVHYQNPYGGDTTLNATLSSAIDWACIVVQLKAAAAAAGLPPRNRRFRVRPFVDRRAHFPA